MQVARIQDTVPSLQTIVGSIVLAGEIAIMRNLKQFYIVWMVPCYTCICVCMDARAFADNVHKKIITLIMKWLMDIAFIYNSSRAAAPAWQNQKS